MNINRNIFFRTVCFLIIIISLFACKKVAEDEIKRPNILFCISDDQSFPHAGVYGCQWIKTPVFDRIASEGLLFHKAYTPDAKCAPSRSAILTGRNPWQLEEAVNHVPYFPSNYRTFPEILKEEGYHVGYTGKGWGPGNPGMYEGKKRELVGRAYNQNIKEPPTSGISNIDYVANFREFLKSNKKGDPFCFWFGAKEPHRPYEFKSGIKNGKSLNEITSVHSFWPDNDIVKNDILDYAYEVEYFDQQIGEMLKILEEQGELSNTIVIVTSDNGMPFPRVKGQEYEFSNHLPLAIMWPDGIHKKGLNVNDFVSLTDLAPTILREARVSSDILSEMEMEGRFLSSYFRAQPNDNIRSHVLVGKERHDVGRPEDSGYPIRGIITDSMVYLKNFYSNRWPAGNPETGYMNCDGSPTKTSILQQNRIQESRDWQLCFGKRPDEELYNYKTDWDCMVNLANLPEYTKTKEVLFEQMSKELKEQKDLRILGKGEVYESYPYADNATLNFYGRYFSGENVQAKWINETDIETIKSKE
ncbi:sulfatase [Seonamhaeicola sp. NFXS20]